ncbi:DUF2637 domain-containing protein [Actinophytocola oryzae]|uniref:Uncharacterized protein DUF2637 n=1 Tax=Actinophytocola oryzae TaxID=502181 RepID=A0A4R7V1H6_9PSEU|nr:DUF2637 domain-containing protein [Actinophytocola oryzae]TDV41695.1 uncharacterized protein DUF2637 [Actinophytocola oryzae]
MTEPARSRERATAEEWARRTCTLVVAGVAAYASYQHQREYARVGGSDAVGAALWPLSVDGLLVLATVGVLRAERLTRRGRIAVWLSFWLGIAVSLAANISAAPTLTWQPVLVAGWPPVALLLAVELLAHGPRSREHTENEHAASETGGVASIEVRDGETENESGGETAQVINLAGVSSHHGSAVEPTAQEVMWEHYLREQALGRIPTGAELDRVAGTNNYGRTVLRQWRTDGRIPQADQGQRRRGGVG